MCNLSSLFISKNILFNSFDDLYFAYTCNTLNVL
jgi:hypothetical protein